MTMTLNIPDEYRSILHDAVASGAFGSPEEALSHALTLLAAEQVDAARHNGDASKQPWAAEFRSWAESHTPRKASVDFDRESIYEGRGL